MFKDNTVFVIGAGASAEFELPVGWQLLQAIKDNCDFKLDHFGQYLGGSREVYSHYLKIFGTSDAQKVDQFNLRLEKSWQIRDGIESADSIDEYIFRYTNDSLIAEVGKLHIANAISLAESNSSLSPRVGFQNDVGRADKTWIWGFAKALMNGVRAEEVDQIGQNITIICFNYDRCIEHYLEYAFRRGFHGLPHQEARAIVDRMNIIHPYGWLGDLEAFPFGEPDKFPEMANNLITWSESIKDAEIVSKMRMAIKDASQIVFMGFGFAAQNMELLDTQPEHTELMDYELAEPPDVYATALGIPHEVEGSLKSKISALYTGQWSLQADQAIHFQYGAKCKDFFDIHRLNLVK